MKNQLGFVLKVFLLSIAISFLIKYVGPIPIAPTSSNALIIVLLPTTIMAIALLWRSKESNTSNRKSQNQLT
jgi:hypothetical protein